MRGSMVLVDTSVFVAHFRGGADPVFADLLLNRQVYLSSYVRLELVQGVRKSELPRLHYVLGGLEPLVNQETVFVEAEWILMRLKRTGLFVGVVDLLLAAQANLAKCPVYSLDKIFDKLAALRLTAVL